MVINAIKMLNYFPMKGGISPTMSPKALLDGLPLDYKQHLRSMFGAYCQVHEEDKPRNGNLPRTKAAICVGPSDNNQGGYKFYTLRSGKKVTRRAWDELPMPDTVIDRVNELGKDQPELLTFKDRKGRVIGDVEIPGVDGDFTNENAIDPQEAK